MKSRFLTGEAPDFEWWGLANPPRSGFYLKPCYDFMRSTFYDDYVVLLLMEETRLTS